MFDNAPRPVYRHLVVNRRDLIEKVANPEQFQRLRQQIEEGSPLDDDIKHLYVKDTLKKTMRKVFGFAGLGGVQTEGVDSSDAEGVWAGGAVHEAKAMLEREDPEKERKVKYRRQEGVIVSRIVKEHIPGGNEPMPLEPAMLHHPGVEHSDDPLADYLDAANHLRKSFERYSDRKFLFMDEHMRAGCTLVTVVVSPIMAVPRPNTGFELLCEFYQKTRFGHVDTTGFNVVSERGEFPISIPSTGEILTLMKSADELFPQQG